MEVDSSLAAVMTSANKYIGQLSLDVDGPIFSIDYRLAPENKFPDAINDCWQVYLWLLKYSEKYLKLKFEKVFLEGNSAGGNLMCGITTLSIVKNVRIPDGLFMMYPALDCSNDSFSPSIFLCFNDLLLNVSFLLFALENY